MFDGHTLAFVRPQYLWLLCLLPALWVAGAWSLSSLGRWRQFIALSLRSAVLLLFVLAMAEIQLVRSSDRLTVVFLLDQSLSIPAEDRRAMLDYVNHCVDRQRLNEDRAGVVVFGKDAVIEQPPFDARLQLLAPLETEGAFDPRYTDLSAAVKTALAAFPADSACRIVIVSDGNQNRGEVLDQAILAREAGVGIDVIPIHYLRQNDVRVERLSVPTELRAGQRFEARVAVHNGSQRLIGGRLQLRQTLGGRTTLLAERRGVQLEPGDNYFSIPHQLDEPGFFSFDAEFVPDRAEDDLVAENNRATSFSLLAGAARLLLIEDEEQPGRHERLLQALRGAQFEVVVQRTDQLFTDAAELQEFDAVILANAPREAFSRPQMELLARNTETLGSGLIMLGGANSLGAGGWQDMPVEAALPVDFQIKNGGLIPSGALALVIDRSGSMSGEKLAMAKGAAIAAAELLLPQDYIGVVAFDSAAQWVVPMTEVRHKQDITRRIRGLGPGGGTNAYPAMVEAYKALKRTPAAARHMVVLTDGNTEGTGYEALASQMAAANITVTTVAVGPDADVALLKRIAEKGAGKFYAARTPKALPKIFMNAARTFRRQLIHQNPKGFTPAVLYASDFLSGIDHYPPLTGFVMSTRKDSPLIEVGLVSPEPGGVTGDIKYNTLVAGWQYGLGRGVVVSTDSGAAWANAWTSWEHYDQFYTQLIRWAARPAGDKGDFSVSTTTRQGRTTVLVTANGDGDDADFRSITGSVLTPVGRGESLVFEQTGPGRYEASFASEDAGSYFLAIQPGVSPDGRRLAALRAGVNVPYPPELREERANPALLETLANSAPRGGPAGQVYLGLNADELLQFNPFRHDLLPAVSSRDIWQWLVIAAGVLFLLDVFNRRVVITLEWLPPVIDRLLRMVRRQPAPVASAEYLERLRNRKAEAVQQIDQQRAAVRFEPSPDVSVPGATASPQGTSDPQSGSRPSDQGGMEVGKADDVGYTDRLLKAKQKIWSERKHEGK